LYLRRCSCKKNRLKILKIFSIYRDSNILYLTTVFFVILFFGQYLHWKYLFIPIGLFVVGYMIYNRSILPKSLELYAIPLILVFLGLFMVDFENDTWDILRDIAYYLNPIFLLAFSFIMAYKIKNLGEVFLIVITLGVLFAIIHLGCLAYDPSHFFAKNIFWHRILSSSIVPLALAMLLINKKYHFYRIDNGLFFVFFVFLVSSIILSLTRTFIVISFIFLFFGFGILRNRIKLFIGFVLAIMFGSLLAFYVSSHYHDDPRKSIPGKIANSVKEMMPEKNFKKRDIYRNWRGYETYRGYLAFKNDGGVKQKICGYGFGKNVNLGLEMNLAGDLLRKISVFHNGYINILLKTGILGLFLYLLYWLLIIMSNHKFLLYGDSEQLIIGSLLIATAFSFLFMTLVLGGWLNNSMNAPLVILMGVLYNLKYRLDTMKDRCG
jgi:O-antigen ligase